MNNALEDLAAASVMPPCVTENTWQAIHRTRLDEIKAECYSWTLEKLEWLSAGDARCVRDAITYLEADAFIINSGYMKKQLARRLARLRLRPGQKARLARAIVAAIGRPGRVEMRAYGRLARTVSSADFIRALRGRCRDSNPITACRAGYLLHDLAQSAYDAKRNSA